MKNRTKFVDERLAERIEALKVQLAERIEAVDEQAEVYRSQAEYRLPVLVRVA